MIRSRLISVLVRLGLKSVSEYRSHLESLPKNHPEWQELINALTTNKTDFFREIEHFHFLENHFLPFLEGKTGGKLNAWSAASSTGEEPYTLSMVLNQYFGTPDRFEITASDIDTEALAHAQNGVYPLSRLDQIPEPYSSQFVVQGTSGIEEWGKISAQVKKSVSFKQCNLVATPWSFPKRFDIILCRNVFIYFTAETISKIVSEMFEHAAENAVLMIGHTESFHGIQHPWTYVQPSVFVKGKFNLKDGKK